MELHLVLAIASLFLFSGCARWLMVTLRQPVPALNFTDYSKLALRVKKTYQVTALGLMTLSFLSLLTFSWLQIFDLI
jgi:hypothetical protein